MFCFSMMQKKDRLSAITYFILLVFILTFKFIIIAHAEKSKPLWTPEDVVTLPVIEVTDVSADGKYTLLEVIYTAPKENDFAQLVQCVLINNEDLTKEIIGTPERKCKSPQFIGQGDNFSYLLKDTDSKSVLLIKNIATGKAKEVQKFGKGFGSYSFAPDGKSFVYTETKEVQDKSSKIIAGKEDITMTSLYLQKLDQNEPLGAPQLLTPPPLTLYNDNYMSYVWSPDNTKIAFTTSQPTWKSSAYMTLHIVDLEKKKTETLIQGQDSFNDLFFSPNGQKLAYLQYPSMGEQGTKVKSLKDRSASTIQIIDLNTKEKTEITATDIWTIAGWTEEGNKLILLKQIGTKRPLCSLDIRTNELTQMDVPHISCVNGAVLSKNRKYIGFIGENLSHPGEAYHADLNHFFPKKVSSINEALDLSEIQAHSLKWTSYDGLEIEGILIYPQEYRKGQKVPLIASIHGGPQGVESEVFIGNTWFGQYSPAVFSSQGYATLVINYRGSLGYGIQFQKLDYQDMGGGDFKDIMAGVDYLLEQGIAVPEKLFMAGHSYGGFMGAWTVGHTDRFKAVVISAGIVDWISDVATADYSTTNESTFGGLYWDNYDLWRQSSPLSYVNNVKTPTLILQGLADLRVPKTQAQQFYQALRNQKIPTRLVTYFGEGHSFENPLAIIDAMNETLDWFKVHEK